MSRQTSAKPDSCTERGDVDPTRTSVKVSAQYPGRSGGVRLCYEDREVLGGAVRSQAEAVVGREAEGLNDADRE